ncbi:MAG: hypothetical protein P8O22_10095 [Akkermansiaceae bacterium]|nr:hypothetical protein [Akkermansiaceae bacterium]
MEHPVFLPLNIAATLLRAGKEGEGFHAIIKDPNGSCRSEKLSSCVAMGVETAMASDFSANG